MGKKTNMRQSLIAAVKTLLKEKSDVTVKEISAQAFVNVAAINYYFGSKDELIAIAVSEIMDGFKREFIEKFDREFESYEGCLEQLLNFLMDFYGEYKGAVRYIIMGGEKKHEPVFSGQRLCGYISFAAVQGHRREKLRHPLL